MDNTQLVHHFGVPAGAKVQQGFAAPEAQNVQPQFVQASPEAGAATVQLANPPQQAIFNQATTAGWNVQQPAAQWHVNHVPIVQGQNGAMMVPIQQANHMTVATHATAYPAAPHIQHQATPSSSAAPSPTNASNPAAPKKNRKKKGKKARPSVFVGGIRTDITERELRNFFGVFGKINYMTIKEGYAFLDFADDESARTAVEKCNGYVYDGKPLGVRIQDDSNRRTAQDAKKAGQNVSVVFKRLEEGHAMGQVMQQAPQAVSRPAGLPNAQPGVMAP